MKYAKKMKLVEIGDVAEAYTDRDLPSDENLTAPRILSMLDISMNTILNRNDISDGEKWALYNQALQKYLYHMKKTYAQNSSTKQSLHSNSIDVLNSDQQLPDTSDTFSNRVHTPEVFSKRISEHDISGIFPINPSIENITQPSVREFFRQARLSDPIHRQRETNQLSPISHISFNDSASNFHISPTSASSSSPQQMSIDIQSPEKSRVTTRRPKKRGAANDITGIHPYKVVTKEVIVGPPPNLQPTQLYRNRNPPLYWQPTTAK